MKDGVEKKNETIWKGIKRLRVLEKNYHFETKLYEDLYWRPLPFIRFLQSRYSYTSIEIYEWFFTVHVIREICCFFLFVVELRTLPHAPHGLRCTQRVKLLHTRVPVYTPSNGLDFARDPRFIKGFEQGNRPKNMLSLHNSVLPYNFKYWLVPTASLARWKTFFNLSILYSTLARYLATRYDTRGKFVFIYFFLCILKWICPIT